MSSNGFVINVSYNLLKWVKVETSREEYLESNHPFVTGLLPLYYTSCNIRHFVTSAIIELLSSHNPHLSKTHMTIGTSRAIVGGAIVLIAVVAGFLYYSKRDGNYAAITNFTECQSAGYQIRESNPPECQTPDGRVFVGTSAPPQGGTSTSTGKEDKIQVTSPAPNQIVNSPLLVEGKARGYWYFEASFPIELIDGNGKRLFIGPAQAKGEWMTNEFVPFSVTLTFAKPTTATGTLILRKDNPSGLPENEDELRIPVQFSTAERTVKLYYYNSNLDKDANGNILCSAQGLVAVNRTIPVTQTPLQDTVRLLLRGELSTGERSSGVTTEFPLPGVVLTGASLPTNGALTLMIADPANRTSGGACRAQVLRAQIEATVRQFSGVVSVNFSPLSVFQP
jgi:hypothetical protein